MEIKKGGTVMKKIFSIVGLLILAIALQAQTPLQRNNDTKIVDALNQLPAENSQLYNRLMADIESTGTEGIEMLIAMLERNDESRTKVEYALDAYAAYAGSATFDKTKREALKTVLQSHLDKMNASLTGNAVKDSETNPWAVTNRELLVRMLRNIKGYKADAANPLTADEVGNYVENLPKLLKSKKALATITLADGTNKTVTMREARMAAVNSIQTFGTKEQIASSLAQAEAMLRKIPDEAKADVLHWMGMNPDLADTEKVKPLLQSKNGEVAEAAAWTLARVGKSGDIAAVASLLKGTEQQRQLAEACLKCYPGNVTADVVQTVGDALTPEALAIIAARKDATMADKVFAALKSDDESVKAAAYVALKDIAREKDLERLYTELETCQETFRPDVEAAVLSAIASKDKATQYSIISGRMEKVGTEKAELYWPLAIKTADSATLLKLGRNFSASGNNALLGKTFDAYMATVTDDIPGAQRLLMLRNAMELAKDDAGAMSQVLVKVGKTNVLPAVFYAGRYLDNASTAQAAAQAIRTLTSGHNEINGPDVRGLMAKAKEITTGQDSQYYKTELQQQLDALEKEDEGYVSLFNGKDLTGWKGLLAEPYDNPLKRSQLKEAEREKLQKEANELMNKTWSVHDGVIVFNGQGRSLATEKKYGNFEMYLDWRLLPGQEPDAGIYLRGTPQVQIWDTARTNVGAEVGSGGLYNNQKNESKPLCVADNPLGEWNSFYIKMVDERVTVYLNGKLVVNNVLMENYWDRSLPLPLKEQIELQAHGSVVEYRDIYIHELPQAEPYALSAAEKKEGYKLLFDGTNLNNFQGDFVNYNCEDGTIYVKPRGDGFGNLYTKEEYQDFVFRFEFKLTAGANNGIGIRAEMGKDAAYYGMEIQVLDHYDKIYQPELRDYQYHGSVYGIIPTQNRDCLKPLGEWNEEEIYVKGNYIRVTLNGTVITEGNIKDATKNGTYDGKEHPGLFNKTGYIGFLGHGSELWFRHVRVKRLK